MPRDYRGIGAKGGAARAAKMTPEERSEAARQAATAPRRKRTCRRNPIPPDLNIRFPPWARNVEDSCVERFLVFYFLAKAEALAAGAERYPKAHTDFRKAETIEVRIAEGIQRARPNWGRVDNDIARAQQHMHAALTLAHQARRRESR